MDHHFPELDEKFVGVEQLRHDESGIERSLNPSTGKDDGFEK
jgi:hypothetical protein